jgi:hypothetical protein
MKLNFHQRVLAYAALYNDNSAVISYNISKDGGREFERVINSDKQANKLILKFKKNPKDVLAVFRNNMLAIAKDPRIDSSGRENRLHRYMEDWWDLMCALDKSAFPSTGNKLYTFVPLYVPDNLSDMGSDPRIDEKLRSEREKIHIRKKKIFKQSYDLFMEIFGTGVLNKKLIAQKVAIWVYKEIPYDKKFLGGIFGMGKSIPLDFFKSKDPTAACRHHALYTQVLNQAFGLTSRLLKCNLNGESHAANLVRLDNQWYLLDSTNPMKVSGKVQVCLSPISQREIDINRHNYTWQVKHDGGIRTYESRNNMFFRIK